MSMARYRDLFATFSKIGVFTFGGGFAMLPLIENEVVDSRGWLKQEEFIDLLTLAQSIPGPISLNVAAFVGYKTRGYKGAITAVLGVVIPSFTILLIVALFFSSIRHNAVVEAAFKGMRPVVIALIAAPTINFLRRMPLSMIIISLGSIAIFALLGISPIYLLIVAVIGAMSWTFHLTKRVKK